MSLKSEDYAKLWVPVVAHVVKLLLDLIFGTKTKSRWNKEGCRNRRRRVKVEILTWLIDNLGAIAAGAVMVLTGLGLLARLTKNPADDKWVAKILEFFKLLVTKKE